MSTTVLYACDNPASILDSMTLPEPRDYVQTADIAQVSPGPDTPEPMLVEPVLKFDGRILRNTISRYSKAICTEETCPMAWEGTSAFFASGGHVKGSGHTVRQYYTAEYQIAPNPDPATNPKHKKKA